MRITLTSKEFDEAISLWLKDQGFSTDRYSITTRTIAGRSDSGAGTRMEVTLDPLPSTAPCECLPRGLTDMDLQIATEVVTSPRRLRFGQGHEDE